MSAIIPRLEPQTWATLTLLTLGYTEALSDFDTEQLSIIHTEQSYFM